MIVPALLLSCKKEAVQEDEPMRFERVQINIGEKVDSDDAETRSLVTIDGVEKFVKAALFAFDSNGHIIVNTSAQDPYSLAITTTSQAFEWDLPVNTDLKIYVLENYGDLDISGYLGNTSLTVSDLEGLKFVCASSSALAALDSGGKGMPMSGINEVRIQSAADPVNITVGKLFARYNFKLDVSGYTTRGYSVNGVYVKAMKSNTEVPFFMPSGSGDGPVPSGFRQTDYSKLQVVDTNSQDDLLTLDAGGYVTLYFLENCQGLIYPSVDGQAASSWRTIYKDFEDANALNKIANCSYIEFGIKVARPTGEDETFIQRVYLGDDMRNNQVSNFNVRRNVMQTLAISLSPSSSAPPTEAFRFDHSQTLVVEPGGDVTVNFGWNGIDESELKFKISNSYLTEKSRFTNGGPITIGGQTFPCSGHATFTASSTANGVSVKITGGKNLGDDDQVYDQISVAIQEAVALESVYAYYSTRYGKALGTDEVTEKIEFLGKYSDGSQQWLHFKLYSPSNLSDMLSDQMIVTNWYNSITVKTQLREGLQEPYDHFPGQPLYDHFVYFSPYVMLKDAYNEFIMGWYEIVTVGEGFIMPFSISWNDISIEVINCHWNPAYTWY